MIDILSKEDCCGCTACVQRCPKQCIKLVEDEEGFLYPHVDKSLCIDCGLCEKVCPIINQEKQRQPLDIYAAIHPKDQVRLNSSSGGVFSSLAESVLREKGVVFGARFNEKWEVVHDSIESIENLNLLRGSKYVQSNIGDTFKRAETFLKKGKKVLFVGTPCQIAGFNKFLCKKYDNLITVDFVCHGVPSPRVWKMFMKEQCGNDSISNIEFRNKMKGWRNYSLVLQTSKNVKNYYMEENTASYMKGFLNELYLRPSCYNCPAKSFKSGSDITLGDYWWIKNINPSWDDDHGCSLVYVNSSKGLEIFNQLPLKKLATNSEKNKKEAYLFLGAVSTSAVKPVQRTTFFENVDNSTLSELIFSLTKEPLSKKIKGKIKSIARKITPLYQLFTFVKNKI